MKKATPKKTQQFSEDLAEKMKALSHPVRLEILDILKEKCCICGEIVDVLPLSQATVSQHLKVLKDAGFIIGETDGTKVCYMLNQITLDKFKDRISHL
jgi:DNA-binding transcriptional ArsR family regulator